MSTYHFRCETCQEEFSLQLSFGSKTIPACPNCKKKTKVTKIMKAPMVHFKGSGFYKTDSATKPKEASEPKKETPKAPEAPKEVKKESPKAS
jgi:putative FmdB family regulatory protein